MRVLLLLAWMIQNSPPFNGVQFQVTDQPGFTAPSALPPGYMIQLPVSQPKPGQCFKVGPQVASISQIVFIDCPTKAERKGPREIGAGGGSAPTRVITPMTCQGKPCPDDVTLTGESPVSEKDDVPAIQIEAQAWECLQYGRTCPVTDLAGKPVDADTWFHANDTKQYHLWRQSCADKSRILMHDENEPVKYWCHKVKP